MKKKDLPKNKDPIRRQKSPAAGRMRSPGRKTRDPAPQKQTAISADRLMAIERRKSRSRAIGLAIFVMFIMLITVLLIIAVMQQARPKPRFLFITGGQIDHAVRSTGLIMRDEIVMQAPAGGLLKPVAVEGSRVAGNQNLAVVIPENQEQQLLELQKTEKDMVELQLELMNSGREAGARAIYAESNASLLPIINLIRQDASHHIFASLNSYEASIEMILAQRTAKLMTIDFSDARLTELQSLRSRLEMSLGLDSGTIKSETPGLVSYKLDGLEDELNIDYASVITPGELKDLLENREDFVSTGQSVASGQPVLRIVSNIRQRLVFLLANTREFELILDQHYDLYIPSEGVTIPSCRLIRSEQSGEELLVVFQTDRLVERFSDRRILEAEIIKASTSGLKIPVTSLLNYDEARGKAEIMIVSGGFTRISKVRVLDTDRETAIVESWPDESLQIGESTLLVVNPQSIEEGEYIGN